MTRVEILFYVGIVVVAIAIILGIILFFVFKLKTIRLQEQLTKEYGPEISLNSRAHRSFGKKERLRK